jgi:hypothetical protein
MLDSGHFAVEDSLQEIVGHIKRFYDDKVEGGAGATAGQPAESNA